MFNESLPRKKIVVKPKETYPWSLDEDAVSTASSIS